MTIRICADDGSSGALYQTRMGWSCSGPWPLKVKSPVSPGDIIRVCELVAAGLAISPPRLDGVGPAGVPSGAAVQETAKAIRLSATASILRTGLLRLRTR